MTFTIISGPGRPDADTATGNAKYLGSIFTVDGSQTRDLKRRVALAMARCGALRQVFDSKALGLPLKLSIYKSAVTSLLTYGSEA